jgi:AraC family transcriptional regulator
MIINDENFYIEQINKVQDYIESHLDEPLTIKQVCQITHFSEYHFQRIYGYMTGECLYGFIKRLRLEKAAYMLLSDKERSILDIALEVGFSNQAAYAKAFRAKYGMSSSNYRNSNGIMSKTNSVKNYLYDKNTKINPMSVEIRKENVIKLIYTRYTGAYKGDGELFSQLFHKLYQWANQRKLITESSRWFVIYHDFGDETEEENLRLSVCMSVDRNVAVNGEVGFFTLHEGQYAMGRFMVESSEFEKAWHYMYSNWLPRSGYKTDDRFSLEHYPKVKEQNDKRLVEIYIPIICK